MATTNLGRIGFVMQGDWSAGTYKRLDVVNHNGSVWSCAVGSTTEEPGTGADWQLLIDNVAFDDNSVSVTTGWSSQKISDELSDIGTTTDFEGALT